jgi:sterol desaturase/sphingolipid hydroxylase (fatty acid hydroxylase superfamily)
MRIATDFLLLYAVCLGINLAGYFLLGWAMSWLAARHPERRLQPNRNGLKRAAAEIRESVASIAVTAACLLALALTLQRHGLALFAPWEGWLGLLASLVLLVVLYDAWFYWGHRLLHSRAFYGHHQWHHRSVAPTVWSSDSQTFVETALLQSFLVLAAVLLPVTPAALVLHRLYDHVNGQIGHSGYEFFADRTTRYPSPMVCVTFHDQHHELFAWNYGNYFSVWDRIMGTLHPDYDRRVAEMERPAPLAAREPGAGGPA